MLVPFGKRDCHYHDLFSAPFPFHPPTPHVVGRHPIFDAIQAPLSRMAKEESSCQVITCLLIQNIKYNQM